MSELRPFSTGWNFEISVSGERSSKDKRILMFHMEIFAE